MHTRCPNTACAYDMESAEVQETQENPLQVEGKHRCPRCNTWMGNVLNVRRPKEPERYVAPPPPPEPEPIDNIGESGPVETELDDLQDDD